MSVYFLSPKITISSENIGVSKDFFNHCKETLDDFVTEIVYINSNCQLNQLLTKDIFKTDILIFFNAIDGKYSSEIENMVKKFCEKECRIWPIAMESNSECRTPPKPAMEKQSFDICSRKENRHSSDTLKPIAQIFSRKIVSQILSPLYRDEVLYFISHKRQDGEHITAKLADQLTHLNKERNVYRDVVNVAVGDDAQKDIDEALAKSDVVIFIQTEEAKNSNYIMKELIYALVNDIPVLWIQIDNASYEHIPIKIGQEPALHYNSCDFDNPDELEQIANEIEEKCFNLIMNSSNQVFSYIQYLNDMASSNKIKLTYDNTSTLAYGLNYKEKSRDRYSTGEHHHYIQCYGRNPQEQDIKSFKDRVSRIENKEFYEKFLLLSNHGKIAPENSNDKFGEENYDDYIINLENIVEMPRKKRNKKIVISGAFPNNDEIYVNSLIEALLVYCREIIKRGYTLVFGAHPTFQKLIFEVANLYSDDMKYAVEMHMDKFYLNTYNQEELESKCTLVLSDGLTKMREQMIMQDDCLLLICLGGKIKNDKSEQGVDSEVNLAKKAGIPIALVGTVGGRSSEYASEMHETKKWIEINNFGTSLNEELYYNINHRLMAKRLLDFFETTDNNETT